MVMIYQYETRLSWSSHSACSVRNFRVRSEYRIVWYSYTSIDTALRQAAKLPRLINKVRIVQSKVTLLNPQLHG